MSFIQNDAGRVYAPGYFLASADCARISGTALAANGTSAADGSKYIKMGTVYPSNDNKAEGIIYEDVDVSAGDAPCSVVIKGVVYEDRLPVDLVSDAKTALIAKGFQFLETPTVTRSDED